MRIITMIETIEHIQYDKLDIVIKNIFEMMSPDLIIITTPN